MNWLGSSTEKQVKHAEMIASAAPKSVVTSFETDAFTAITELSIYTPDHPRLLALITGACAAAGANIAGAQIFTTTDGMALDTILIQREFTEEEDERRRAERTPLSSATVPSTLVRRPESATSMVKVIQAVLPSLALCVCTPVTFILSLAKTSEMSRSRPCLSSASTSRSTA